MKKAVLYARVSSEIQQKEHTIDSQVEKLKQQIVEAGDVLVKEYADDGYSGSEIRRPALDQLRADLKANLFDTVYFLNTDRIARDVAHQTIIISEILKAKKQIIINGKDYVHNPENKFALTVLGAVAELERAKILERSARGRQHRLRGGFLLGYGYNLYGYTYIPRKKDKLAAAKYVINEDHAKVVRQIFERYAKGESIGKILRYLEDNNIETKEGKKLWRVNQIHAMLKRHTYMGIKYFNTRHLVKEPNSAIRGIKYGKKVYRDKSEWIGIKVPAIVSKQLFDKVQERIEETKSRYKHPKVKQLLCNLIKCGECGHSYHSYRRFFKKMEGGKVKDIYHKVAYKCNWQAMSAIHRKGVLKPCKNPEMNASWVEAAVWESVNQYMLDDAKLRRCMDFFGSKERDNQISVERKLRLIDDKITATSAEKKELINQYALGKLTQERYAKKSTAYDAEINKLRLKRIELLEQVPLLHKKDLVEESIAHFCNEAKSQFRRCMTFETKREFLLKHIDRVMLLKDNITIYGYVPVLSKAYEDPDQTSNAAKIEFRIGGEVNRIEARAEQKRSGKSMKVGVR